MDPLLSIIIPTYDRTALLEQTLESIMSQDYGNFEVIVVDDGSPRNETAALCEAYPQVSYFRIANSGGPSAPRNEGIRSARGEFVAFVDDDDLWVKDKVSKQLKVLRWKPEVDLVHSCCQLMTESGLPLDTIIGRPGDPSEKSGKVYLRMIGNWTLMTSSVMLRRSLVDKVGFFNEEMPAAGEDLEYWARCAIRGNFEYIDEPLVMYRQHTGASQRNLKAYLEVPGYLLRVVKNAYSEQLITKAEYEQLKRQLLHMQIKKFHLGSAKTILRLFRINPFWFLNFDSTKLLAAVIFKRRS